MKKPTLQEIQNAIFEGAPIFDNAKDAAQLTKHLAIVTQRIYALIHKPKK